MTTQKLERLMAAAPNMGFKVQPEKDYNESNKEKETTAMVKITVNIEGMMWRTGVVGGYSLRVNSLHAVFISDDTA